ncbi:ATP-binding protein [Pseudoalteromonas spongiae]|uniref:ATP-binding protein n=1 Tax=Pseudoalteromonas spongiae TaxID=298657 RepID=UPI00026CB7F2
MLLVLMPAMFFSIGKALYASLVDNTERTLEAHLYSLMAKVEIEQGELAPITLIAPELTRPVSDTFAYIYLNKEIAWQSESTLGYQYIPKHAATAPGIMDFSKIEELDKYFRQLSFVFYMDADGIEYQVTVLVLKDEEAILSQMQDFQETLRHWLIIIAIVMGLLIMLGFLWSSHPLKRLDKEIVAIESGNADQINGEYPEELEKIQQDLNLLLATQQRQKDKYRASLSDLAHALKTPLAVLKSSDLASNGDSQEQLDRISNMIEHQLKKAASGGTDTWKKQTKVKPILDSIINAMGKVYRDKGIQFIQAIDEKSTFLGDKTDLMELLGNILDNACKACDALIEIKVKQLGQQLIIEVGDDGPGVPADKIEELTIRGKRLDTYEHGHGVGMAIVGDLMDAYNGKMTIATSQLGGALFTLVFNYE